MVTVLILESCAGAVNSYGVNSVVDLPNNEARSLINAGLAKVVDKEHIVTKQKEDYYPIAIKLNYGKEINN